MFVVLFTFLFVDMFDTVGTLVGVSSKAGLLDDEGKLPKAKQALLSDAIGTTFGAILVLQLLQHTLKVLRVLQKVDVQVLLL